MVAVGVAWFATLGCGDSWAPNPFTATSTGGGQGEGVGGDGGADLDAGALRSGTGGRSDLFETGVGAPCSSDRDCDDQIFCTVDHCDPELGRCRRSADPSSCDNGVYCDGSEGCDLERGCVAGEPVSCSDANTCTVDQCREASRSCEHRPRDADGDGDPDGNCNGGGDCDDTDPARSSLVPEICHNGKDDDCDGVADESDCGDPKYDVCATSLNISASGHYRMDPTVATANYAASCISESGVRDLVLTVQVPASGADLDITAESQGASLGLASATQCGDAASEFACAKGVSSALGGRVARLHLRSLVGGSIPITLYGSADSEVDLSVAVLPSSVAPANETCGTAVPLEFGTPQLVSLVGARSDLVSECSTGQGDLLYRVTLDEPRDLKVQANSEDGRAQPVLSLIHDPCASTTDELTCREGEPSLLFARALPVGTYYLGISATGPSDVTVLAELAPPSAQPPDETCDGSPFFPINRKQSVSLAEHTDELHLGCFDGSPDAFYSLELAEPSDVAWVASFASGDQARVALVKPPCGTAKDILECRSFNRSPARAAKRGLAAGSYRVAVETSQGGPVGVTALVRPAAPAILVPFADTCSDAVTIPAQGGRFEGNTANAQGDYSAGCDGASGSGAPDQMLRLELSRRQRVILDTSESDYTTLLDVRRGPDCPGKELEGGCAAGYVEGKSYLDLDLEAGTYFVQIDGYSGDQGPWVLEAYVVDPSP